MGLSIKTYEISFFLRITDTKKRIQHEDVIPLTLVCSLFLQTSNHAKRFRRCADYY
jgi:hypothetical protein